MNQHTRLTDLAGRTVETTGTHRQVYDDDGEQYYEDRVWLRFTDGSCAVFTAMADKYSAHVILYTGPLEPSEMQEHGIITADERADLERQERERLEEDKRASELAELARLKAKYEGE